MIKEQAAETDVAARFPDKAVRLLRDGGLMGLLVPVEYGGIGGDLGDLVTIAGMLGSGCTSTAMIWAMHCQQVDCLVRFATPKLRAELLPRIAAGEIYLASITTEPGKGGHLLSGRAALDSGPDDLRLDRDAPIVTGAAHAEGFLVTMREAPDAADHRVSLCFAYRDQLTVTTTAGWDTLGMRGTESRALQVCGTVADHQLVGPPGEFKTVAVECMIPAGHLAWSALWLGAARRALSDVLTSVRARGRGSQSDLTWERLARARIDLELGAAYLGVVRDEVLAHRRAGTPLAGTATQIHLNNLKVIASERAFSTVDRLMQVAGLFLGYKRDSAVPLERIFRDLRSASLNYSNDRLLTMNGSLTLMDRGVTLAADVFATP
jgi:acyl-CoA dehydrogenase